MDRLALAIAVGTGILIGIGIGVFLTLWMIGDTCNQTAITIDPKTNKYSLEVDFAK